MLWIPITFVAAFLQTVRNAAQRGLTGELSSLGATYTRFLFGFPFALVYCLIVFALTGGAQPHFHAVFFVWVSVAAVAQIIGTAFLLQLFALRNFSTGIVLSKSEILLVAIFGLVFLGDDLTVLSGAAILAATGGLVILSSDENATSWRDGLKAFTGRPALYGLITGVGYAIGSVGFRAASLSLAPLNFLQSAALTLVVATFIQATLMTIYLKLREPGQVATVIKLWRKSMIPGIAGGAASAGWFTAMTIEVAAYVRMLGLVEVLYGFLISVVRFHERPSRREIIGSIILIVSILALLADRAQLL